MWKKTHMKSTPNSFPHGFKLSCSLKEIFFFCHSPDQMYSDENLNIKYFSISQFVKWMKCKKFGHEIPGISENFKTSLILL